jgi:hypothetical protein
MDAFKQRLVGSISEINTDADLFIMLYCGKHKQILESLENNTSKFWLENNRMALIEHIPLNKITQRLHEKFISIYKESFSDKYIFACLNYFTSEKIFDKLINNSSNIIAYEKLVILYLYNNGKLMHAQLLCKLRNVLLRDYVNESIKIIICKKVTFMQINNLINAITAMNFSHAEQIIANMPFSCDDFILDLSCIIEGDDIPMKIIASLAKIFKLVLKTENMSARKLHYI